MSSRIQSLARVCASSSLSSSSPSPAWPCPCPGPAAIQARKSLNLIMRWVGSRSILSVERYAQSQSLIFLSMPKHRLSVGS